MRLIRLLALLGALVLMTATGAMLFEQRAKTAVDLENRAGGAGGLGAQEVDAKIDQARSLVAFASLIGDGEASAALDRNAEELLAVIPNATACWGGADNRCDGDDTMMLSGVGKAARIFASADADSVAVAEPDSGSIVVYGSSESQAVIVLPLVELNAVANEAAGGSSLDDPTVWLKLQAENDAVVAGDGFDTSPFEVVSRTLDQTLDDGSIEVLGLAEGGVGIAGGKGWEFAGLLAASLALLGVAAWVARVERSKLEQRATTDDLTGLVNRREFERQGNDALIQGERMRSSVCIMLIDLNGFKQINDTKGHRVGDLVLEEVAKRLEAAVRDTDVVGRWGGDEFVALLPGLDDGTTVRIIAERIAVSMAMPIDADGEEISASGSIGAAIYPRHGANFQQVLSAADEAMYAAKTTGVIYRLADTVPEDADILSDDYVGPDRRSRLHSEV